MENLKIAYCGLYCGECGKLKRGRCPGCYANEKATWCEIRKCCMEYGFMSCADCTLMLLRGCKKYNNIFAKVIGFVTRTERSKCIDRIREVGYEAFAKEMGDLKIMSIRRG